MDLYSNAIGQRNKYGFIQYAIEQRNKYGFIKYYIEQRIKYGFLQYAIGQRKYTLKLTLFLHNTSLI